MRSVVRTELVESLFVSNVCGLPASRGLPGGNSLSFASPKESKQRKGDPAVCVPPLLTLRRETCGARQKRGLARTRLRLRQSRALIRFCLRSAAHTEGWGDESGSGLGNGYGARRPDARSASGRGTWPSYL